MTTGNPERIASAMGLAAIVLWSTNISVARSLAENVGAVTSTSLMFLIGGILGLLHGALRGQVRGIFHLPRTYLLTGGATFVGYTVCLALAIGLASNRQQTLEVAILNYLWPTLTLLFSAPILGNHLRLGFLPGALLALAGSVLVVLRFDDWTLTGLTDNLFRNPWPYLFATAAAILWGLHSNMGRKWTAQASTSAVPLFALAAGTALFCIRPLFSEPSLWTLQTGLELLYMALFPTLIAYGMWDRAMRKGHNIFVASVSHSIPVLATLFGAAYLQVPLTWNVAVACCFVTLGALLCNRSVKNEKAEGSKWTSGHHPGPSRSSAHRA